MLVSFLSLLAVLAVASVFGIRPSALRDPALALDPRVVAIIIAVLIVPILIVATAERFVHKSTLGALGFSGRIAVPTVVGLSFGAASKLVAMLMAIVYSGAAVSLSIPRVSFWAWAPFFGWFLIALVLNSFNEELVYRAYPLEHLGAASAHPEIVVICAAAFFSAMHFLIEDPDPSRFIYRLLFGILVGMIYLGTRSIWMIVGIHTGWNFVSSMFDSDWRMGGLLKTSGLKDSSEIIANSIVLGLLVLGAWLLGRRRVQQT
jgi:membrane protease YdiL (CAAX protease family)